MDTGAADGRIRSRLINSLPRNRGISAAGNSPAFPGRIYYAQANLFVSN